MVQERYDVELLVDKRRRVADDTGVGGVTVVGAGGWTQLIWDFCAHWREDGFFDMRIGTGVVGRWGEGG